VTVPDLAKLDWKTAPGTPEADPKFDDGAWLKTEGRRSGSTVRGPTGQPALDMSAYGFHQGDVWYRGRYTGKPDIDTLTLHYGGGGAGMLQVWLDGRFLGQHELDGGLPRPITTGVATFKLPDRPARDRRARDLGDGPQQRPQLGPGRRRLPQGGPRPDLGLAVQPTSYSFAVPIAWKIQGNLGGEDIQDPVRGNANNGGQYGERMGWHLPGFPDAAWAKADMAATQPAAGTTWYRTSFDLNLPKDQDTTLGLTIGDPNRPALAGPLPGADLRQWLEHGPVHRPCRPAADLRPADRHRRPARQEHPGPGRDQRRRPRRRPGNRQTRQPAHRARRHPRRPRSGARFQTLTGRSPVLAKTSKETTPCPISLTASRPRTSRPRSPC
jgi:hypothetical protein